MNILFAYRAFDNVAGGVQKTMADLMNEMVRRGHTVSLLTWDKPGVGSYFKLEPSIKWHQLGIGDFRQVATWSTRLQRMMAVRKAVGETKPDVIIGYQDGMYVAMRLFTAGMGIPVIAAERNAPSRFEYIEAGKHKDIVYALFGLSRYVTIQCESYRTEYPSYLHKKIRTISNPVYPASCQADPAGNVDGRKILLSVGRLGFQKNFQCLVKAFRLIAHEKPDWDLVIVGDGEDRAEIERMIADSGLEGRIRLPGTSKDVPSWYCKSQMFCLPSRWEGFPNVLAEAMAHGLPCAAFERCGGVKDLIADGENGLHIPGMNDPEAMARVLKRLMDDEGARVRMGAAAARSVKQYLPERIFDQWEDLFQRAIGKKT